MYKLVELFRGKKTYFLGALGLLVIALYLGGLLDVDLANSLLAILGFGGLIALRAGVAKLGE